MIFTQQKLTNIWGYKPEGSKSNQNDREKKNSANQGEIADQEEKKNWLYNWGGREQ